MSRVGAVKASNHPYVERKKKVCGGRPVIRGTRFPISSVVWNHKLGFTVEEILREFPHLTPAQVYDALSYYLCGGDKGTQTKDIKAARKYWADYRRRHGAQTTNVPRRSS